MYVVNCIDTGYILVEADSEEEAMQMAEDNPWENKITWDKNIFTANLTCLPQIEHRNQLPWPFPDLILAPKFPSKNYILQTMKKKLLKN